MTSRTRLVVVLCSLLALAGCGGSSDGSQATPSASPTPKVLTAAEAKTAAAAGILTAADLPGYKAETQPADDAEDKALDAAFRTCAGIGAPDYLAEDPGRSFTKGDLEIDSSVDVTRTVAALEAELEAYTGAKGLACFKSQFTKIFTDEGATVSSAAAEPVTVTVPGSDSAFGLKLSIDAAAGPQAVQLRGWLLGAAVGQVEISVAVFGTPTTNLTLAEVQALLVKATDRVKAAV